MAGTNGYNRIAGQFAADASRRVRYDRQFELRLKDRQSYESRWRSHADYYLPTRPRWTLTDANKGDRANNKILDSTGTRAADIATAGLLAMMASPARPWFIYGLPLSRAERSAEINRWLAAARDETLKVLERSNFYTALAELLKDELIFATGAMAIYADRERIIRCHTFPIGSYVLGQDSAGRVTYFGREVTLTVEQAVTDYGFDNCSPRVQSDFMQRNLTNPVEVRHKIERNDYADEERAKYDSRFLPWSECIWEKGGSAGQGDMFLKESGYHEFPVIVGRWERNAEDTYATNSPGHVALGPVKTLQAMMRKYLNALEKSVDPALVGGSSFKNRPASLVSGDVTVEDETQGKGLRPIHDVRLPFDQISFEMERVRGEIKDIFGERLYLMWTNDTRAQPPTAAEVYARDREKLILGPTQERHGDEVLGKAIERVMNVMIRMSLPAWEVGEDGLLPQMPEEIEGMDVKPEYISEAATAQKVVGISSLERHLAFIGGAAQLFGPSIVDNVNGDKLAAAHADMLSVPPDVSTSEDERAEIRAQRAKAEAAERAAQAVPAMTSAAKDLGTTPMDQDTALTRLIGVAP